MYYTFAAGTILFATVLLELLIGASFDVAFVFSNSLFCKVCISLLKILKFAALFVKLLLPRTFLMPLGCDLGRNQKMVFPFFYFLILENLYTGIVFAHIDNIRFCWYYFSKVFITYGGGFHKRLG